VSNDAPVEMSIDVLEERIPEEQRGRGKKNERWYCQLYQHRDLPCAQVGETKKPVNEAGVRHYATDYDTKRSRYAQQVLHEATLAAGPGETPKIPAEVVEGQDINRVGGSPEGELKFAKEVEEKLSAAALGSKPEYTLSTAQVTPKPKEQSATEFLRSNIREFKGLYEDQYEMVAVRGKLLGRHESGKLIVQLPGGVEHFTPEEIIGVFEEFMPGEPLRKNTIITHENGSKVWRFIRGGWLDITSRDAVPLSWRKLWKQYEANLQFWRNHDV
jgi:hypothetical protein